MKKVTLEDIITLEKALGFPIIASRKALLVRISPIEYKWIYINAPLSSDDHSDTFHSARSAMRYWIGKGNEVFCFWSYRKYIKYVTDL